MLTIRVDDLEATLRDWEWTCEEPGLVPFLKLDLRQDYGPSEGPADLAVLRWLQAHHPGRVELVSYDAEAEELDPLGPPPVY